MKGIIFKPWKAAWIASLKPGDMFMTRRPIKPQPRAKFRFPSYITCAITGRFGWYWYDTNSYITKIWPKRGNPLKSRYLVGETVYIKETWGLMWPDDCENGLIYDNADPEFPNGDIYGRPIRDHECMVKYKATEPDTLWWDDDKGECTKWKSPLFLPARFARSFAEIVEVKAERVQDISQEDCYSEGVRPIANYDQFQIGDIKGRYKKDDEYDVFRMLWDSIRAKQPDLQWKANPWVWCYTLKKIAVKW